jgi:hypothetical protein
MRQVLVLAWKEWREVRWVLAVAAILFVALPLIGGLEGLWTNHQFRFTPHFLVIWCGGILGTLAGAFAAARDLRGPVAEFFQSRAIGVVRRWIVKYAVGLVTIWVACLVPLAIEIWADRNERLWNNALEHELIWLTLTWAAQYSLGFVCGSVTRRAGPAVMLAFGLTLLAYFLPLIVPPLQSVSIWMVLEYGQTSRIPFLIAAIAISLTSLAVAVLFVRMDWRIRAGQGLMYWSIAIVVLLLFASAAFQVASNLPVLQEIPLEPGESVISIDSDGHRGALLTWGLEPHGGTETVRTLDVMPAGVRLGERIPIPRGDYRRQNPSIGAVWLPAHPDVCFSIREIREAGPRRVELDVVALHPKSPVNPVATLDLGTGLDPNDPVLGNFAWPTSSLHGAGNDLLAMWLASANDSQTAVVDVSDPMHPRLALSDVPLGQGIPPLVNYSRSSEYPRLWDVYLPPLPGASDQERVQLAVRMSLGRDGAFADGKLIVRWADGVLLYRLARLFDGAPYHPGSGEAAHLGLPCRSAEFQRVGSRDFSFLEQFLLTKNRSDPTAAADGHAYLSMRTQTFGRPMSRVTVLDISNPTRPRPVAHFAAPDNEAFVVQPLPDGRALIGGRKLYLVGPPPSRSGS